MDLVNQLLRGEVRFSAMQLKVVTGEYISFSRSLLFIRRYFSIAISRLGCLPFSLYLVFISLNFGFTVY